MYAYGWWRQWRQKKRIKELMAAADAVDPEASVCLQARAKHEGQMWGRRCGKMAMVMVKMAG
jgi:hypothetical protein